ncbi:LW136 [Lumpy skin disease virus]|nr:LW136 [Lumpy skin disease virus]
MDNNIVDVDEYRMCFIYDKVDYINIDDPIKNVIEEYFLWRGLVGRIGRKPSKIGKLFVDFINLDLTAKKMLGDLDLLFTDILKLDDINGANERLSNFVKFVNINFNNKPLVLLGLLGAVSEFWGKKKISVNGIMSVFLSNISNDTLLEICNHI